MSCTRCRTMSLVLSGVAGLVFGIGLLVSGMTQPAKIVGFLDPLGDWDPSLAFVMGGAMAVYIIAFRVIRSRRNEPWFDVRYHLPTRSDLDRQLIVGAGIFGIGWGFGGLCPGPGLVSASSGATGGLVFAAAMLVGMFLHDQLVRR